MDLIGEGGHDLAQEGSTVGLGVGVEESDVGELRDLVDDEEHEELTFGQTQLADVYVDIADPGLGKALSLGGLLLTLRQAGDAVPLQAAVQGTARESWDHLAQAAQDIVQRQQATAAQRDDDRLLGLGEN
jgi:hypothetical protein